jgi:hypothetical protein
VLTSTAVLLFFLPDGFGEGVLVGLESMLGEEDGLELGMEVGSADGDELLPGIDEPPLPPVGSADGDELLPGIDEPPLPPGIEVESADGDELPLGSCAEEGEVPEIEVPARAGMANIKPKNPEQVKNVFGEIIFE